MQQCTPEFERRLRLGIQPHRPPRSVAIFLEILQKHALPHIEHRQLECLCECRSLHEPLWILVKYPNMASDEIIWQVINQYVATLTPLTVTTNSHTTATGNSARTSSRPRKTKLFAAMNTTSPVSAAGRLARSPTPATPPSAPTPTPTHSTFS